MERYEDKYVIIMEEHKRDEWYKAFDDWFEPWGNEKSCAILDSYENAKDFLKDIKNLKRYLKYSDSKTHKWSKHPDSNETHVTLYLYDGCSYTCKHTYYARFIIRKIEYYK